MDLLPERPLLLWEGPCGATEAYLEPPGRCLRFMHQNKVGWRCRQSKTKEEERKKVSCELGSPVLFRAETAVTFETSSQPGGQRSGRARPFERGVYPQLGLWVPLRRRPVRKTGSRLRLPTCSAKSCSGLSSVISSNSRSEMQHHGLREALPPSDRNEQILTVTSLRHEVTSSHSLESCTHALPVCRVPNRV